MQGSFVRMRRTVWRLRGLILGSRIRLAGGVVGRALQVDRGVVLRWQAHPGLRLGDDVYLGVGAIIDVPPGGRLHLGDRVKVMHYCVLAASESIEIGADSQVAEFSSIRDSDHGLSTSRPMRQQTVSDPTRIGVDVWIGRGCAVLRGSDVRDGAVIGANSVVRGLVPELSIAVGAPARVIRQRGD